MDFLIRIALGKMPVGQRKEIFSDSLYGDVREAV